MQTVKEKLQDMSAMRKVKAEAKAEEKAEKELAKARMDVAHEVRLARVAEAEMDLHVAKAENKADREIARRACRERNNDYNNNNNRTDATAAPGGDPMMTTTNPTDAFSEAIADATAGAGAGPTYPASGAAPRNNVLK